MRSFYFKSFRGFSISFTLVLFYLFFCTGHSAFSGSRFKDVSVATSWAEASFPVENFQEYTDGFGYRINPVTGKKQFHAGLDIAAPLGSYVRAWWSGQIVRLSDNS